MKDIKSIMMVFGTRPEAIKMAPLYYELLRRPNIFKVKICVTGQHKEMLYQVLDIFKIKPDIDLELMKDGQDLFDISSSALLGMRDVLLENEPDIVLVHGDTTTSFIAALSSFYLSIPVGHIEAGLRTHNIKSPFPEEFNRQTISKVSKWHFAPTKTSKDNLIKEGTDKKNIYITGNTVIDSLFHVIHQIETSSSIKSDVETSLDDNLNFNWKESKFILITGHRRENFGDGFLEICHAIKELSLKYKEIHFVYPVHLNPNVQNPVNSILQGIKNIHLIKPLQYEPFIYLLKHSFLVLTDSGGIQEEAPSFGKPVIVMRDSTERPEAVDAGTVILSGANKKRINATISNLLDDRSKYESMSKSHNPYGDGNACKKIADILEELIYE